MPCCPPGDHGGALEGAATPQTGVLWLAAHTRPPLASILTSKTHRCFASLHDAWLAAWLPPWGRHAAVFSQRRGLCSPSAPEQPAAALERLGSVGRALEEECVTGVGGRGTPCPVSVERNARRESVISLSLVERIMTPFLEALQHGVALAALLTLQLCRVWETACILAAGFWQ